MNIQVLFVFFINFNISMQKTAHHIHGVLDFLFLQKQLLHNIFMGNGDFYMGQFFLREKAKIFGFTADTHLGFFREIIAVYYDHHPPDTAVPIGRNPAGIVVNRQLFKLILGNPDTQFLIYFPGHGLEFRFIFFDTAAN